MKWQHKVRTDVAYFDVFFFFYSMQLQLYFLYKLASCLICEVPDFLSHSSFIHRASNFIAKEQSKTVYPRPFQGMCAWF